MRQHHGRCLARLAADIESDRDTFLRTCENISKALWLSAGLLALNPEKARENARLLHDHIIRLPHGQGTPYEKHWKNDDHKMALLDTFAQEEPAILLWRGNGRYKDLVFFLGPRHEGPPDHVLDCESKHAEWQFIELTHRAMKLKMLNAILKIKVYLEEMGSLPAADLLDPYLQEAIEEQRLSYRRALADQNIAPGMQSDCFYRDKLNMRPCDIDLLKASLGKAVRPVTAV